LNVFPEDVERALVEAPGVRDAAAVGRAWGSEERVHAVLVLDAGMEADAVVRAANARLGDHQKVRSASVWPSSELPRTEGTRKLKRRQIKQWVDDGAVPAAAASGVAHVATASTIVARFARGRADIGPDTTLDELGLSSLERVELLMALEERYQTTLDEAAVASARTVADLEALVREGSGEAPLHEPDPGATGASPGSFNANPGAEAPGLPARRREAVPGSEGPVTFPRWNRSAPAWWLRRISLPTWMLPLARVFAWIEVRGLEHLDGLTGPVVFAVNHQSHFDTPAVLYALPSRFRYRLAVAMAKEFFSAHFFPERHSRGAWLTSSLNYYLASLFFNAFPLPQREAGTRQTLRYIGALLGEGYSVLIFPEGKRTNAGEINPFRPGIGMIGARLQVPVVPVRLTGLEKVLHHSWKMAKPGPAAVTFGPPLRLDGDDYAALAQQVEDAVRRL
jgi:long-chain acyl-CoA synthetase